MPLKILSVVGARPQFIKAAPISRGLRDAGHTEILVHTGQHYDYGMSKVFFEELGIAEPGLNLEIGSGPQGWQTGQMLIGLEKVMEAEKPDWVLVYGDTNSTLAGALAAAKLHIKLTHVEAGLRSFNRRMPEEINRVTTDHLSDLLFCPSQTAVDNLKIEGISKGVHLVGDIMADALLWACSIIRARSGILDRLRLPERSYLLATIHRADNTDDLVRLGKILSAFNRLEELVVFPVHPRTNKAMKAMGFSPSPSLRLIDPVSYLDMVQLMKSARMILTDSGGVQKEAYWLSVPCITLRDETEWVETVQMGWNVLAGSESKRILESVRTFKPPDKHPHLYGNGQAGEQIVGIISGGI